MKRRNVIVRIDALAETDVDPAVLQQRLSDAVVDIMLDIKPRHFAVEAMHRVDGEPPPGWDVRWGPR